MVERIRALLGARQLTPTQFADAIGIARPIISHILSGRNKPSLEVVQRILAAMPELSMAWLLNGTGPMQPAPAPSASATPELPVAQPLPAQVAAIAPSVAAPLQAPRAARLPRSGASPVLASPVQPAPKRFASSKPTAAPAPDAPQTPPPLPLSLTATSANQPTPPVVQSEVVPPPPTVGTDASPVAAMSNADKPVRRIVIFYRDGSFADYQPE